MRRQFAFLLLFSAILLSSFAPVVLSFEGVEQTDFVTEDTYSGAGSQVGYVQDDEHPTILVAGYTGSGTDYTFIEMNFTLIKEQYELGYFNDNAHIRLYWWFNNDGYTYGSLNFTAQRIIEDWDVSTLTGLNMPSVSSTQTITTITKQEAYNVKEYAYIDIHDDLLEALVNASGTEVFYGYRIATCEFPNDDANYFYAKMDSIEAATFEPVIIYGNDEQGEGGGSGDSTDIEEITDFLTIALVVFFPALALGGSLASSRQTASLAPMGFVSGLVIGVTMGVIVGIVPTWAVIFVGMGVVLLLWGASKT